MIPPYSFGSDKCPFVGAKLENHFSTRVKAYVHLKKKKSSREIKE